MSPAADYPILLHLITDTSWSCRTYLVRTARVCQVLQNQMGNTFNTSKPYQQQWLEELTSVLMQSIHDPNLRAEDLASQMYLSRSQFHRRVFACTGMSPGNYIREMRLLESKRLLELGPLPTVKEVACRVGYRRLDYFAKIFRERFGVLPSVVLRS